MTTASSIQANSRKSQLRPIGFAEDECDQLIALIQALAILIPAKFSHNLESKDFDVILNAIELQAERVRAALDMRAGHA